MLQLYQEHGTRKLGVREAPALASLLQLDLPLNLADSQRSRLELHDRRFRISINESKKELHWKVQVRCL